ncbi:MAG: hypothetical protein JWM16_741 [Verrucomicrobiales bacterium]|nr:hypothetical protein [Verrucomicrobiales bacterium]
MQAISLGRLVSTTTEQPVIVGRTKCFGLVSYRAAWRFTWRAWICFVLCLAVLVGAILLGANRFLAVNQPLHGDVLVVEGWLPAYGMKKVAEEYLLGNYDYVLVVRALYDPLDRPGQGLPKLDYLGDRLIKHGVPADKIHVMNIQAPQRHRTYHSAMAAKAWIEENSNTCSRIDVASLGPHARRSRLMFEKAFGHDTRVGIIAVQDRMYNPQDWWRSSEGTREVVGEGIAYVYARLLFSPPSNAKN